ncbi:MULTISPECIES: ATPase, T2SS/T4P/T4SS family [unclassified Hydrogenobaculum]|uniref:ATPase, T2SS/T4P/T4SS family n=1 Tax=unclassified Hydrogenobaculum TaxID=2622382 RepID=UPI0001C502E3|nr:MULTISPECIES: ATPase, T2SS/T4P/T4SS family [unclassified Hydrogenobaculum]AEF19116.1 type II secretion system protein E [Hydrogenobaculum sp. 3684]AEG46405.1 type II secretion system protein E [Hydrogenobaculum sp. SHO]AGG15049.1 type II secretion system protein E [Hydrogenobaculum sp. HO]AGH93346.1 Tfp pilus assembly protein, pilus retraction ATPase PilT [Hydrogenobaculum sp. SN]
MKTLDIKNIPSKLVDIFEKGKELGATDFQLIANYIPRYGIAKKYAVIPGMHRLTTDDVVEIIELTSDEKNWRDIMAEYSTFEYSFAIKNYGLYRVSVAESLEGLGMAIRILSYELPSIEMVRLPKEVVDFMKDARSGAIIHTGGTTSGKSTSIAAEIGFLSDLHNVVILTFENPVEYRFLYRKATVKQFNMPTQVKNFQHALKIALRSDPSIILFGEVRSEDEIISLLDMAARGHLVFSTLHTKSVSATFSLLNQFGSKELLGLFSSQIVAIISQFLYRSKAKKFLPIYDILVPNKPIRTMIADGNFNDIERIRQEGKIQGGFSITFTQCAKQYLINREIDEEEFNYIRLRAME